ncbi:MAG: DUF6152 family protein [Steroidobacteraceae bacterium]
MKVRSIVAVFAMAAIGSAALAHHSFAMFDQAKRTELKGKVTEFQWTNPHAFIHMDVPGADGKTESWAIELNSPNNLKRQGWRSTSLKPGDAITLVTSPLRDMTTHKGGLFVRLTLADGTVLGESPNARSGPINVPTLPPPN